MQTTKINVKFRVLIIGRANAGKTSILQRVCDTTESPKIYRLYRDEWWHWFREEVQLDPTNERGKHNINDELIFTNHDGYVFHDSRGIESGEKQELEVVQKFVREKSTAKRLKDRLHAIWYCIPTDNQRPSLDLKYFNDLCPDQNVPVIAVFTKYEQFKFNIRMKLEDEDRPDCEAPEEAERVFKEEYLKRLGGMPQFVRLERMHDAGNRCTELLETTAKALHDDLVAVMLLAVRKGNLKLSVKVAVTRACIVVQGGEKGRNQVIDKCLTAFPYLWYYSSVIADRPCSRSPRPGVGLGLCSRQAYAHAHSDNLDYDDDDNNLDDDDYYDAYVYNRRTQIRDLFVSFVNRAKFSPSSDIHHVIIAVILIMEHATFLLLSDPTPKSALAQAQTIYMQFAHAEVAKQFPAVFQNYSEAQFVQFILDNRLSLNK